jgi:hypothetical protein
MSPCELARLSRGPRVRWAKSQSSRLERNGWQGHQIGNTVLRAACQQRTTAGVECAGSTDHRTGLVGGGLISGPENCCDPVASLFRQRNVRLLKTALLFMVDYRSQQPCSNKRKLGLLRGFLGYWHTRWAFRCNHNQGWLIWSLRRKARH